jgi:formylglycine-generating enzyme required for sulfatase activity/thiol-disulfide isomerase/thioredoxin
MLSLLSAVFFFVVAPTGASAWENVDVKSWLGEPGVRLVAVEFFATWCKPCMEAVPKWEALHKKYRKEGLRLVVVSVQSEGSCARPPKWNPDRVICDIDGNIAASWKLGNLPQGFLWSWQGNLLAHNTGVDEIEKAVESYFHEIPRILIQDPTDENDKPFPDSAMLKKLVRSELTRASKFVVVPETKELEALRTIRKDSYGASRAEHFQCELGQEVSANSLLKSTVMRRNDTQWLILDLLSAERGCLIGSSRAQIEGDDYLIASAEAVTKLVKALGAEVTMPGANLQLTRPVVAALPGPVAITPRVSPVAVPATALQSQPATPQKQESPVALVPATVSPTVEKQPAATTGPAANLQEMKNKLAQKQMIETQKRDELLKAEAEKKAAEEKAAAELERQKVEYISKMEADWRLVQQGANESSISLEEKLLTIDAFTQLYQRKDIPNPHEKAAELLKTKLKFSCNTSEKSVSGLALQSICPGTFFMGSPEDEKGRRSDEKLHKVTISRPFWLGNTEVTQGQWISIMGPTVDIDKKCGNDCPVENLTWYNAVEFVNTLSNKEGFTPCYSVDGWNVEIAPKCNGYRLPTEAEWEYAARAGTGTPFSTGKCLDSAQANYDGDNPIKYCPVGTYRGNAVKVGSFPPNVWGLFDMHGNVSEWVWDVYGSYPSEDTKDPAGPKQGILKAYRVTRGGDWYSNAKDCRSAWRQGEDPTFTIRRTGFRVARSIE